ncbi:uncharacterized protein [Panulirus ornatus]|uniref:uncharacterized protein n=1 Tax=Panulirus ornatus TaxID=150431 RepID=UPI003A83EF5F
MAPLRRVKLTELNAHLVCVLCSGYFVDATTIIECLHTFCKTCIVRYLQTSSFCPICDVQVHKTKPLLSLREDRTLQDVVFKLVPGLFHSEMNRRLCFYKEHPEAGGDKTEQSLRERRHFFHVDDQISLSLEYLPALPSISHSHLHSVMKPLKVNNGQQEKQKAKVEEDKDAVTGVKEKKNDAEEQEVNGVKMVHKRYLRCPAAVQVSHLEKFIRLKYSLAPQTHRVDIMHGGDCLMGELTLLDVVYMYKWTEDAPLRLTYTVTAIPQSRKRLRLNGTRAPAPVDPEAPSPKIPRTQVSPLHQTPLPPVSPHPAKGQDVSVDDNNVTAAETGVDCSDHTEVKEEVPDQVKVTSSTTDVINKIVSTTSVMQTAALLFSQNHSILSTSGHGSTSSSIKHLSNPASTRGRPALTTTTSATATPRVALARMPSPPVNVNSSISVCMSVSEPATTSYTTTTSSVAMINVTTTTTNSNFGTTSSARIQMPQSAALNGVVEGAVKPVRSAVPHANKIPQPIIPTRPRLGRPPNSSRIAAATMKVPSPRLGDVRNPRPPMSVNKKMSPAAAAASRGNQIVSASLNVTSRLSSISGQPVNVGASKVSLKRSNDALKGNGQTPDQSDDQVKKLLVSPSSLPSNTSLPTENSQAIHYNLDLQPTSESTPSVNTGTRLNQGLEMPVQGDSVPNQKSDKQALQRPAESQSAQRHQGTSTNQRPSSTQPFQRSGSQACQRANGQANQKPTSAHVNQRSSGPQASQRPSATQVGQRLSGTQVVQRLPSAQACHRAPVTQASQRLSGIQPNQRPSSHVSQQHSGAHANQGQPSPQITQQSSGTQSIQQPSGIQSCQTPTGVPAVQKPAVPVAQRLTNISSTTRPPNASVNQHLPISSTSQRSTTLATPRPPGSPAPHRQPNSPAPQLQPSSPAPHHQPNSPAPHKQPSSPAPQRQPSNSAPHRQPSSPAPHRQPSSPAPHRQSVSTTSRPQSSLTTTPVTKSSTSPGSASPRSTSSSPTTPTVSVTPSNRETLPVVCSTSANSNSVAGFSPPGTALNGKSASSKSGVTYTQARASHAPSNQGAKTSSTKNQSSTAVKAPPKSPGRGRGSTESSSILKVLANRDLQQRILAQASSTSNTTTVLTNPASTQVSAQDGFTSTAQSNSVYPGSMGGGPVPPALAAVAYMAACGDATLADAAMRNLLTITQTAARIREMNLATIVQAAESIPRTSDPAPIDLSPTSKAAPQSPLANGRAQTSTATVTKTTVSHACKSPSSKTPRSANPSSAPTISPPTPEVTITKLPNTLASSSSSSQNSSAGTGKNTTGSIKLGSTNTNTVSITKRPASNNRIAVAKSPANASVRQIPNPSFLRHQSEARNNVSKSSSVSSASSTNSSRANTTISKTHSSTKHSSASGRATGNSPLKETGPLPETSSILKIEHLTRSLPAPAAAASHALRFINDR